MTGQSAGTAPGAEPFFNEYFGARHTVDSLRGRTVQGVEDDPVAGGRRLLLLGDGGARNQVRPGAMEAIEPAVEIYHWLNIDGNLVSGVRREDPNSGSRTVYLSFGMEAVSSRPHRGYISREEVLGAALNWLGIETGMDEAEAILPIGFRLDDPYPNPFNSSTMISYQLPQQMWVSIRVYDFTGREVASLQNGSVGAGYHTVNFDGYDFAGGIYFIRLETESFSKTVKVALVK
ncbi:MAG: T9SS type A sorting domain-containing protein [Candidatus Electryoneaceae bacterium]|nr:T9SS type A sorting domain-containing protein [Candidatus Electryoneaceae bacterium]